jgi:hypothetical protein
MTPPNEPQAWQLKLPKFNELARDVGKVEVWALYKSTDAKTMFYVAQGEYKDSEWIYWGYAVLPGRGYPVPLPVTLTGLALGTWVGKVKCKLDEDFTKGPWLAFKNMHFPPDTNKVPMGRIKKVTPPKSHPDAK